VSTLSYEKNQGKKPSNKKAQAVDIGGGVNIEGNVREDITKRPGNQGEKKPRKEKNYDSGVPPNSWGRGGVKETTKQALGGRDQRKRGPPGPQSKKREKEENGGHCQGSGG